MGLQLFEFTRRLKGLPFSRPVIEVLADSRPGAGCFTYFGDGDLLGDGNGDSVDKKLGYEENPPIAYFRY